MKPASCWALLLIGLLLVQAGSVSGRKLKGNGNGNPDAPGLQTNAVDPTDPFESGAPFVEDELLVMFKPGTDKAQKDKALGKGNAEEKMVVQRGDDASGDISLVKVKMLPDQATKGQLKAAAAQIKNDEDVEVAEPNFIYTKATNDPGLNQLWGMLATTTGGANAVGAWSAGNTDCSDVVIGIIDTGIQTSHPDLAAHMWVNPVEILGNGIDDDGNGYVDDVYGYDFWTGDGSVYDDTNDDHGTHVAGTIGAVGNNGRGVVGVCQSGLKIISAKFLGGVDGSGSTSGAIAAMNYLLGLKTKYNLNLVATSNSWGGGGFSTTLLTAIQKHRDANVLFIAAAGNAAVNSDTTTYYPQGYNSDNVISVGSITSSGSISSFSNFGQNTVDLFAPGSSVYSTLPFSTYGTYSGTSMATPHVSGAAALYAAAYKRNTGSLPTYTNIKAAIMDSGVASSAYTTTCVSGKRLNVANLLSTVPAGPPPSPSPSPSPEPPTPSPSPEPLGKMTVTVKVDPVATNRKSTAFRCQARITAIDDVTKAVITGWTATSSYAIDPDVASVTDTANAFPTANTLTSPGQTVTSPTIPTLTALKASKSSTVKTWLTANPNFAGTACILTVSVSHPQYETVPAASYQSTTRM